jgi:hypothetical protein
MVYNKDMYTSNIEQYKIKFNDYNSFLIN